MPELKYRGMSYEQASREGERLLQEALKTGRWFDLPELLMQLRAIMQPVADKQAKLKLG